MGRRKRNGSRSKDAGVTSGDSANLFYCLLLVCPRKAGDDGQSPLFWSLVCEPAVNGLMPLRSPRPHWICGPCDPQYGAEESLASQYVQPFSARLPTGSGLCACLGRGSSAPVHIPQPLVNAEAVKVEGTPGRGDCLSFLGTDFLRKRPIGFFKPQFFLCGKRPSAPPRWGC